MRFPQAGPVGFRKWVECETLKNKLIDAAESERFPDKVFSYLSAVFDVDKDKFDDLGWDECLKLFHEGLSLFPKITAPIIKDAPKKHEQPADWDYEGRNWFYYSHLISSAYGWTVEYVSSLNPQDAFAYIQEILTAEQLDKEFTHSLSELSYPYNKSTKQSRYKPMTRPYWMKPLAPTTIKRVRILKDMMPVGRIVDLSGLPQEYQIDGLVTEKPS